MHTDTYSDRIDADWEADEFNLWQLYEHRTRYSPLPLVVTEGLQHIVRYANPAFCDLVKKAPNELNGVPFSVAVPEGEGNGCLALLDRVFSTKTTERISNQVHTDAQGQHSWGYSVWAVVEEEDCPPGVMIQVSDTSETERVRRRSTEIGEALMLLSVKQHEFIEASDLVRRRLELAMRETEHRAKNSFQIISSRLNMQLRANPATVPSIELTKLQMHIKTIATMHELLTFVKNGTINPIMISIREMLQKLLPMWRTVMGTGNVEWSCDEVQMSIRQSTSLATIINELVCNSVKNGAQSITLRLSKAGGMATLEAIDDGQGFPNDFNLDDSTSFGLKFVKSASSAELEGTLAYENSTQGGACVKITFPLPVPA